MHSRKNINSRPIYETCHEFPKSLKAGEFHQSMSDTCKQLRHERSKWPSNDVVNNITDDLGSCNLVILIKFADNGNMIRLNLLSCFTPFCFNAPNQLKLFGFPIIRMWAYMMKVIRETRRAHSIWYLRFYFYSWVDTSAGRLLVPVDITCPVVSGSALTWFIRYISLSKSTVPK